MLTRFIAEAATECRLKLLDPLVRKKRMATSPDSLGCAAPAAFGGIYGEYFFLQFLACVPS